jgi:hypothetical protein
MIMKAASALLLERGHEAPKLGVPEVGVPRVKTPTRIYQKRTEANGTEVNIGGPVKRSIVQLRPSDEVSISQIEEKPAIVCAQFFDYMARIATAAMGPMAHLVLRNQIASLGESQDAFPQIKLRQLIDLVSREILNETMRASFQNMMFEEMESLQPLRV